MNVLFEIYAAEYPISEAVGTFLWECNIGFQRHEVQEVMTTVIALLCVAAIAFDVRFAIAWGQERAMEARLRKRANTRDESVERPENALDTRGSLGWLDNHA